jgi:Protein of unknown function (DUF3489)
LAPRIRLDRKAKRSVRVLHRRRLAALIPEDNMPKLYDTQLVILAAAAKRDDGSILPLPKRLKLGDEAGARILAGLIKRRLAVELAAGRDAAVWRESKDGERTMLAVTDAGLRAIGIEPGTGVNADTVPTEKSQQRPATATTEGQPGKQQRTRRKQGKNPTPADPRPNTKQAQVINLLRRSKGATIEQVMEVTGWQAHSVRGVMSGALKKKLGLKIVSEKTEGRDRVYRIAVRG